MRRILSILLILLIVTSSLPIFATGDTETPEPATKKQEVEVDVDVNIKSIDTDTIDTDKVDTDSIDTKKIDTNTIDTNTIDTNDIDTDNIDTGNIKTSTIVTDKLDVNTSYTKAAHINTVTIDELVFKGLENDYYGSVLSNMNASILDMLYKPSIKSLDDLARSIRNYSPTGNKLFAVNDDGLKKGIVKELPLDDVRKILGGDIDIESEVFKARDSAGRTYHYTTSKKNPNDIPIDIVDDTMNPTNRGPIDLSYTKTVIERDIKFLDSVHGDIHYSYSRMTKPTRENVLMLIYKALGDVEHKYLIRTKPHESGKRIIPVSQTPFVELSGSFYGAIITDYFYMDVYTTRTLPNLYWRRAVEDKIVLAKYPSVKDLIYEREEVLDLGTVCDIVYRKLIREGEPVLTDEELEMMLVAHGRHLPTYLQPDKLDAIKHLWARGIVDEEMDFLSNEAKLDDILLLLARAKEPNYRLTFKNVDYPYIKEVLKRGYYPTEVGYISDDNIKVVDVNTKVDAPKHFDYLVYDSQYKFVEKHSILNSITGSAKNAVFNVGDYIRMTSKFFNVPLTHFKIPIDQMDKYTRPLNAEEKREFKIPETEDINILVIMDGETRVYLEAGGGLYLNSVKGENKILLRNTQFDYSMESNFTDYAKWSKQNNETTSISRVSKFGTEGNSTFNAQSSITMTIKDTENVLWKNKSVKYLLENPEIAITDYQIKITKDGVYDRYIFQSEEPNLMSNLLRHLRYTKTHSKDNKDVIPGYVSDTNDVLVSSAWLKQKGLITDIIEVEKDKKYIIFTEKESSYIDLSKDIRRIVTGQLVTEIDSNDTSPIIMKIDKDSTNDNYLIDYRAVLNYTKNYLTITDVENRRYIVPNDIRVRTYLDRTTKVYDFLGEGYWQHTIKLPELDVPWVDVTQTTPTANWLFYKKRAYGKYADYLLVFENSVTKGAMSNERKQELKEEFGIEVNNDNLQVVFYRITNAPDLSDATATKKILAADRKSEGLHFDKSTLRYFYVPHKVEDLDEFYTNIFNKTDYISLPLIVQDNKVINLNVNKINPTVNSDNNAITSLPKSMLNSSIPVSIKNQLSDISSSENTWLLAPIATYTKYYPFESKNYKYAETTGVGMYYGSTRAIVDKELDYIYIKSKDQKLMKMKEDEFEKNKFPVILRGVKKASDTTYLIGYQDVEGMALSVPTQELSSRNKVVTEITKSILAGFNFDFDSYNGIEAIKHVDNALTIAQIIVISILPRIILFIFLAMMALSLLVDSPLMIKFATKVVDPYKVLSLGFTDISRVSVKGSWLSITIAIAFLGMASSTMIQFVAWIMGVAQALLNMK